MLEKLERSQASEIQEKKALLIGDNGCILKKALPFLEADVSTQFSRIRHGCVKG